MTGNRQQAPGNSRKLEVVPNVLDAMRYALCILGALLFELSLPVQAVLARADKVIK